jgi:hypothetical protein
MHEFENNYPDHTHRPAKALWTRRRFVSAMATTAASATGLALLTSGCSSPRAPSGRASGERRRRVAIIATEVRIHSHAQHFIDRFLEGYGWHGAWHHPSMDLAALYVDQFPAGDLARERSRRFGVPIYPTIAEALTLGGSKLAVDGVLIIGEHGRYPRNEKGQTLYPRYKFFKEVVKVFEASGRAVPLFQDKHLSTKWEECVEQVADSRRLGFPFLAGSSLPVTWRIPSIEMSLNTPLKESVCVCYGGVDSYDFHGLETAQCMSERRAGGEAGIKSVTAARGDRLWPMLAERDLTRRLVFAALARSHTMRAPAGCTFAAPTLDWIKQSSPEAVAYFIEHNDGFRTGMFLLNGLVQDFTYAGMVKGSDNIISCQMHLPMPTRVSTTADFFNPLVNNIERMIVDRRAPYRVERTLLTSGMTLSAVESLHRGGVKIDTPELRISYAPVAQSTFWRA